MSRVANHQQLSETAAASASPVNFDPHAALNKLTNVNCYSATCTSNTPSPSPYRQSPSPYQRGGLDSLGSSPAPSTPYRSVTTPSSVSTTPFTTPSHSPAPLISLDTFLDRTGASSLSGADVAMEDSCDPDHGVPNFLLPEMTYSINNRIRQDSSIGLNSSSGLNASIADTIPELYSFLADLHEHNQAGAALTSQNSANSSQPMSLSLNPHPEGQNVTSDPDSSLNLP